MSGAASAHGAPPPPAATGAHSLRAPPRTRRAYDSEEDRWQARQEAAVQAAKVRATQRRQAALLASYRERCDAQQQADQHNLWSKLRHQQQGGAGDCGDEAEAGEAHGASAWTHAGGGYGTRQWRADERRWAELEATPPQNLRYADVPWPPDDVLPYLHALASAAPAAQDPQRALRHAYAQACLRWHPDKFMARFGACLQPDDRERVLQRVQGVAQQLTSAWAQLRRGGAPEPWA